MRINRIFLDLDDVLNYFTMGVLEYIGCPGIKPRDIHLYKPEWGFDIEAAANWFHPLHFYNGAIWANVRRDFWANAMKTPWCDSLIHAAASMVGQENVFILTSPTNDPGCAAGKVEWIQRCTPEWMHRQYFIGSRKEVCANSRTLLIDDMDDNVLDFVKAGGNAILFPRPWNSLHWIDFADQHVFDQLRRHIWE
jgi:5'(3')-deoxyribonucleotidase